MLQNGEAFRFAFRKPASSNWASIEHQYVDSASREALDICYRRLTFRAAESALNSGEIVEVQ